MILKGCMMIDESLLNSLDTAEKEVFKKGLSDLIEQTYVIENEYKLLNESYESLQSFIKQIVETMPNSIWVLEDNGEIFLQNSEAEKNRELLNFIDFSKVKDEVEHEGEFYLIKTIKKDEKTIVSATDITGEKRRERLASMGQVAAHLSHEIRNPIGSIALLASTLFNRVDIKSKPIVLEMKRSIWRVERIIKATLLFTKGIQINMQRFSIKELESECKQAVSYYTYTKDIEFDIELFDDTIQGDKDLLSLVLQNLLFNAIDAIEEDDKEEGRVVVKGEMAQGFYEISVLDSGKQIENQAILFEPFKTTKTKGNGLGLTLSKQIIEAHDGEICVKKNPKRFCIRLKKDE